MTIDSVQNLGSTIQYIAASGQTVFPVPFPFVNSTDIVVQVGLVPLFNGTDYTVSGAGNDTGGNITLAVGAVASTVYTITRNIAVERLTEYQQNGPFTAAAINAELDNIVLIEQQLRDAIARCLQLPVTNSPAPTTILTPANYAGKYLSFDAFGNPTPAALTTSGSVTQALVGALINPITNAEIDANVVPANYQYPAYDVRRYGASPTASASTNVAAFNAAFLAAGFENDTTVIAGPGIYSINGTLTIDTNKVGFDGRGCFLNCTSMTTGNLWNIIQSDSNTFLRVSRNHAHSLRNFVAQGPGPSVAVKFVDLTDTTGVNVVAGVIFEKGGSLDFQEHFNFGVGAYFITLRDWDFTSILGSSVFINGASAAQSDENNVIDNCRFVPGAAAGCILIGEGNGDWTFTNCKFDAVGFTNNTFIAITGGTVRLTDCHMESSVDGAYWVTVSGFSSSLFISNLQLVCDTVKTARAPFFCNSDAAGISIGAILFDTQPGVSVALVDGTGPVRFTGPLNCFNTGGVTTPAYVASCLNRFSDPGFETASFGADGWVASGGTPPTVVTTNPHSGTHNARFAGVSTQDNILTYVHACSPQDLVAGQCWIAMTGYTTGTLFSGTLVFKNAVGTAIQTFGFASIVANQSYTRVSINSASAPPGTTQVQIQFQMFGTTSGTPFADVDDLMLNIV